MQRAITRGETLGWLFRRVLILAAPFVWRKYTERRRKKAAPPATKGAA